ncbi:MAG: SOS response-associated peptidase family protein [Pseudomonadales bacterium]
MCGRFNVTDDPYAQTLMRSLGIDIGPLPEPRYNIAPTDRIPVIHELDHKRALTQMRWWLVPSWSDGPSQKYAMFNAKSETLAKNRAFRGPFKRSHAIALGRHKTY